MKCPSPTTTKILAGLGSIWSHIVGQIQGGERADPTKKSILLGFTLIAVRW